MSRFTALIALSAGLAAQAPAPAPFVVHEWGTFTSMVGSDGVVLEGLQHEEERLPAFVHELANLESQGTAKALKFPASRVTQKMETPVIYFHTDVPREVQVEVRFPQGLLTQFYPIPMLVAPALEKHLKAPVDMATVEESLMCWQLDLIPHGAEPPAEIPACAADDPWSFARDVRAAYVRTRDPEGVQRAIEAEHYVFYRGLARFELPFGLTAAPGGRGTFANRSAERVPFAAALEVGAGGGRFVELGAVDGGSACAFSLAGKAREPDRAIVAAQLGARVFDALVHEGLHDDEARAMIATWSRSWFQSEGTRVIYVLPRAEVDRVLPLRIHPAPDALVRVLVGRLEFVTPETEAAVDRALADLDAPEARRYLAGLDRFLEPHARRALARAASPGAQEGARRVLAELVHVER